MAVYSKTSPYYTTQALPNYLDVMTHRDFEFQTDDVYYSLTKEYEYRPDLLAFDLYNDVNLWWVFVVRNKNVIKDPVFDFRAGLRIYLPKLSTLRRDIGI